MTAARRPIYTSVQVTDGPRGPGWYVIDFRTREVAGPFTRHGGREAAIRREMELRRGQSSRSPR